MGVEHQEVSLGLLISASLAEIKSPKSNRSISILTSAFLLLALFALGATHATHATHVLSAPRRCRLRRIVLRCESGDVGSVGSVGSDDDALVKLDMYNSKCYVGGGGRMRRDSPNRGVYSTLISFSVFVNNLNVESMAQFCYFQM